MTRTPTRFCSCVECLEGSVNLWEEAREVSTREVVKRLVETRSRLQAERPFGRSDPEFELVCLQTCVLHPLPEP